LNFSTTIIHWYQINKRDLPWRKTNNAYYIWLSEVILQQTRVAQGLSYYYKFIETYPTISHLANASLDDVLKLWQGLGYYSRARNLHFTSKEIQTKYNGVFPNTYGEILALKGIGEYTAAAISSFTYNLPHAVLDGNVYRVLARYLGVELAINSNKAKKYFTEIAQGLFDEKNSGMHNQAIMEFGALQCVPISPNCDECPLMITCVAFNKKNVSSLPVKEKKLKIKKRFFNYFFIRHKEQTFIQQRGNGDIWEGLFEFPLIETNEEVNIYSLVENDNFISIFQKSKYLILNVSNPIKHILTHRHIYCKFIEIEVESISKKSTLVNLQQIPLEELNKYAIPRLIDRYLQKENNIKLRKERLF
jgi:A/G-specific adenine glycosylase